MGKKSFIGLVSIVVIVAVILLAQSSSQLYLNIGGVSGSYTYNIMFNSGLGFILAAVGLGILLGAIAGEFMRREPKVEAKKDTIGMEALLNDWGMSLSSLGAIILLISGIYLGGTWSSRLVNSPEATAFVMNTHFFGMVTLLFGGCYLGMRMLIARSAKPLSSIKDLLRQKGETSYLLSHRLAVLTFLIVITAFIVKGAGLFGEHVLNFPSGIAVGTTIFHDIFALIGLIVLALAVGMRIYELYGAKEVEVKKPSKAAA
ncbi:MAG: hypothetical protein JSV32_08605 [Dehalococcoidia bacterium]|nr:MAG: hypothetical protein JSV32_08605 [Dehalococcoidia bacterium]